MSGRKPFLRRCSTSSGSPGTRDTPHAKLPLCTPTGTPIRYVAESQPHGRGAPRHSTEVGRAPHTAHRDAWRTLPSSTATCARTMHASSRRARVAQVAAQQGQQQGQRCPERYAARPCLELAAVARRLVGRTLAATRPRPAWEEPRAAPALVAGWWVGVGVDNRALVSHRVGDGRGCNAAAAVAWRDGGGGTNAPAVIRVSVRVRVRVGRLPRASALGLVLGHHNGGELRGRVAAAESLLLAHADAADCEREAEQCGCLRDEARPCTREGCVKACHTGRN